MAPYAGGGVGAQHSERRGLCPRQTASHGSRAQPGSAAATAASPAAVPASVDQAMARGTEQRHYQGPSREQPRSEAGGEAA